MESEKFDGQRSRQTTGYVKNGGCDKLSRSGVAALVSMESQREALFKVPYFLFILFEVCPQSVTTPPQHCEGPTAIF